MTRYLSTDELLIIGETATKAKLAVRDLGLLDAAAHRPQATVFGEDAYPTVYEKAAALMHSLVTSHPLIDGNKRLGWLAARVFLEANGVIFKAPFAESVKLVLDIATSQLSEIPLIAQRLEDLARDNPSTSDYGTSDRIFQLPNS